MNSLEMLGEEYEKAAETVRERIRTRNLKLKSLWRCSPEAAALRSEISALYRERAEALEIAAHLKNYYGRGRKNEILH